MREPITVNYVPNGPNWTVTVAVCGRPERRSATAPGLIAARDRADQLVAQIQPGDRGKKIVVHLLDGDAFAFTTNYLHARLGLSLPGEDRDDSGRTGSANGEPPTQKPTSLPAKRQPAGSTPASPRSGDAPTGQRKPAAKAPTTSTAAVPTPRTETTTTAANKAAPISATELAKAAGHPTRDKDAEQPERRTGVLR